MMPRGKPSSEVIKQVIIMLRPAAIWEKQNLTCTSLFTLSRNGMYWPMENIHNRINSQNTLLNYFRSWHLMRQGQWEAEEGQEGAESMEPVSVRIYRLWEWSALSACLSMQAAMQAQRKLTTQMPMEVNRGGPRLPVRSQMIGVMKLLSALPSSGRVVASPIANASSFPRNQYETKQVCATLKHSTAIPKNSRPASMIPQFLSTPACATTPWNTTTITVSPTKATRMPRQSITIPMKKGNTMPGNAMIVQSMLNCVQVMDSYDMMESCRAWGLLKAYMLANTTTETRAKITKRMRLFRQGVCAGVVGVIGQKVLCFP